jgi:hypothetical protein
MFETVNEGVQVRSWSLRRSFVVLSLSGIAGWTLLAGFIWFYLRR